MSVKSAEATVRDNPNPGCLDLFSAFVALYALMYQEEAKPGTDAGEEPRGLKTYFCKFGPTMA